MSDIVKCLNRSIYMQHRNSKHKNKFDKTRTAIIKGRGTSPHRYNISIDGQEYKNVPVNGDATLSIGDACKVTIPNNEMSQMYVHGSSSHKVGDVIFNAYNQNPAQAYGGTWQSLGTLIVGDTNTVYAWQKIQ